MLDNYDNASGFENGISTCNKFIGRIAIENLKKNVLKKRI